MQLTLADLARMKSVVSLRRVDLSAGLDHGNMRQRMRRGSPELTAEESDAIIAVLRDAGITYTRDHE